MSDDRYARVHFDRIAADKKFDGIRENPMLLGSWLLLLIEAEKAWPSPAFPNPWVPKRAYTALVEAKLIDLLPNKCYRVHGLDAVRSARRKQAEDAAAARWGNAGSNAPSNAPAPDAGMPSKAKQEQSKEADQQSSADDPASTYWNLTGKFPSDKALRWIDQLTEEFGADSMNRFLAEAHIADGTSQTLLGRVQDLCRSKARQLSLKERAVEKTRITERRRDPNVVRAYHQAGQHVEAPDPACALCQKGDAA